MFNALKLCYKLLMFYYHVLKSIDVIFDKEKGYVKIFYYSTRLSPLLNSVENEELFRAKKNLICNILVWKILTQFSFYCMLLFLQFLNNFAKQLKFTQF